jgi:hypothetical protein
VKRKILLSGGVIDKTINGGKTFPRELFFACLIKRKFEIISKPERTLLPERLVVEDGRKLSRK